MAEPRQALLVRVGRARGCEHAHIAHTTAHTRSHPHAYTTQTENRSRKALFQPPSARRPAQRHSMLHRSQWGVLFALLNRGFSPRPEPPTLPTSYTTSWDLTSDARSRRPRRAARGARNDEDGWRRTCGGAQ